ncbi:DUF3052 domain-containing protein [Caulobacter sp. KR2-114]|uniref:DUF3052 domain-containing protein n=1 Tax=Caulobacter sp. KR2-114 TaxID=3400912 RepID=UPI003C0ABFCC
MGKETEVEACWPDGARERGRLQYEAPKLVFRGAARRVFEGEALAQVRAEGPDLVLGNGARFALGERAAASWAEAIRNPRGRLDKLGVKAGQRAAIVNLDDPAFADELAGRVPPLGDGEAGLDILVYGADSAAELQRLPDLIARLADRGALWIVSRKGRAATLRDVEVMAAAKALGLVDNKVCSFSDSRTALRFTRRR